MIIRADRRPRTIYGRPHMAHASNGRPSFRPKEDMSNMCRDHCVNGVEDLQQRMPAEQCQMLPPGSSSIHGNKP